MSQPAPQSPAIAPDAATETGYAKSRDTRARILAAALEEAGASGFHKTSVAKIAARAGVALGSLNYHFGSRAELIRELMRQLLADYLPRVQAAENAAVEVGGDYFARERAVLLAYVAYVRDNPAYARLPEEIRIHEPELYRRGEDAWVERMADRLRRGIAEGALRPMAEADLMLHARFLLGARVSLERLVEDDPSMDDEAAVDAYLDLMRRGIAATDGASAVG